MQVTKGVLFDTPSRAAEAERNIRRAAAEAAALDGKFGDCEPAPDVVRLDGSRLSSGGQWWGQVELDPASHDLKKAWLTFKREQFLKPTETATYVFERDGGTTRLGYSQATDGLLKSSLSVFETTLDSHGQPQSAMTIDGQPADIPFARQFLKDGSAEFWKAPILLPHDLEAVTL